MHRNNRFAIAMLLTAGLAQTAGADEIRLAAVLPIDASNATITLADRIVLEESIRTIAADVLRPSGYRVLTGENMLSVLADNGIDAEKACTASCALEAARELKASVFVSGSLTTSEGEHIAFIRLFESKSNKMLSFVKLEGATVRELRRQFETQAPDLFAWVEGAKKASAPTRPQTEGRIGGRTGDFVIEEDDQVVVAFDSEPAGASVLVDGELLCATTPCRKLLRSGGREVQMSMERHASVRDRFVAKAGAAVKLTLAPKFARLQVESTPSGVGVSVNGKPSGKTPLSLEVDPGAHEVLIGDACWVPEGERFSLEAGASRLVRVALEPRLAAIKVSAEDGAGDVVEGEVWVDGERLGRSPGTFKLPVCSREVVVVAPSNERWSERLGLEEKQVSFVQATFGGRIRAEAAQKKVEAKKAAATRRRSWAMRAGVGSQTGILGMGLEWRPGPVGVAVGTGTHLGTFGLSFGPAKNAGGLYLDLHLALVSPGLIGSMPEGTSGVGLGATSGYDWRPVPWLSVKTGIGLVWNRLKPGSLMWDFNLGPVF